MEIASKLNPPLGPLKGKVWHVGLMGHGARMENFELLAKALLRLL
jgi:alanine-glyoxylate transaminase / serine-glyoxylate transaminase / serine-pyruvate transaminase